MQRISPIIALATLIATLLYCPVAKADDGLLPSELTILANHHIKANPGAARKSITTPLMKRLRTNDLPDTERFLKGEAHFLNLQPQEARDAFWAFRDRDDDLGRVAVQRLMIIRINAFGMVDELLDSDIPDYRERFGIRNDDRFGITFPVQRTAELLAEKGDAAGALDLVADHVRRYDLFDAPYTAYALPGQFYALAAENDRADEFRELNSWVLAGLNKVIAERLQSQATVERKAAEMPGVVFFTMFADQSLTYHDWTAEFMKLRDRISAGIATARGRPLP